MDTAYLKSTQFVEHPLGNQLMYGLNSFGCNSIIRKDNEIYKFYAFKTGTDDAIYYNKNGKQFIINLHKPHDDSITRMIDVNDLPLKD